MRAVKVRDELPEPARLVLDLDGTGRIPECYRVGVTFYEWFWAQTIEPNTSDCWEWSRARNPETGYGIVCVPESGTRALAHRVAWGLVHGPIPPDLWILHRCDNPPCVRPSHLFLGTPLINAQDREMKHRGRRHTQLYCVRGHELAGDNLYPSYLARGVRRCRLCANMSCRRYYEARKAQRVA